jgi:hypothetical protein
MRHDARPATAALFFALDFTDPQTAEPARRRPHDHLRAMTLAAIQPTIPVVFSTSMSAALAALPLPVPVAVAVAIAARPTHLQRPPPLSATRAHPALMG